MFETPITVVGTIVTNPERRWVGEQELFKFRVASNSRRRTTEGNWEPGNSLYATVNCWGRLVTGVGAGLGKGDAVIVVGHVYTSEYQDRDGNRRSSLEIRAISVGPDLARCIVRIDKRRHPDTISAGVGADSDGQVDGREGLGGAVEVEVGQAGEGQVDGDGEGDGADGESEFEDPSLPLTA
ncbi:MAG: single-stranded DNA-binding protein [Actinomycetia bacterium]|nr:single-stranded DNA-binding protein [Actinomycetes bacterium]MCH9767088.1 single-stranded DNA-binding protein [Actinomycetes bacterium]